ncbi:MAG: excinuclease ABC subunit UvrC [Clostridia bacterium]|nr:excinuclease ABC subunit UvrC [Clostridia bacterium]
MNVLEEKIKLLPTNPGVYIMLDGDGNIIYVGKAKNLKNRVRQYFFNGVKTNKVLAMTKNIADFYYIITKTEVDALSLENNLIKKHQPKYNILLKDDKTYPYLKINLKEDFPTLILTRKIKKDGAKYFGPFMNGVSPKEIIEIINLAFSLRPCTTNLKSVKRECLNYHLKKCDAPCMGKISSKEYKEKVNKAVDFLNGNDKEIERILTDKMMAFAEKEEFNIALKYKEKLQSLQKIKEKKIAELGKLIDLDIVCFYTNNIYSSANILVVRKGRILGSNNFSFNSVVDEDGIRQFLTSYYTKKEETPSEIVVSENLLERESLEEYFYKIFDKKVKITYAQKGLKKSLVDMGITNATDYLESINTKIKHKEDMTVIACQKLKELLKLSKYPKRMECYDISNISGVDKVGSMTVFIDGEKNTSLYRRFKIKTVEGANDFESLKEVLRRRLSRLGEDGFSTPDLIIIDGGKGQLSSVKEVFDELKITGIDLISLAEREEEIFTLFEKESIKLPKSDYCLRLLQRIRDEAHRFALTYHQTLRNKRMLSSKLDDIKGVGKKIKALLLERFKDVEGIKKATKEELMEVSGVGEKLAETLKEIF